MWIKTGTTTNRIAVAYQNQNSTIDLLGIIKLRSDWMIRFRPSHANNKRIIQEALNDAGLCGSVIKYDEGDSVFILRSDNVSPITHLINAISPLMQDFSEIKEEISNLLHVDFAQYYPNPNWIRASNHPGSTRLKYFSRHQSSNISEIGINSAGREWKVEIKTPSLQQKELIRTTLCAANFPLSMLEIYPDTPTDWTIRLKETDLCIIATFVGILKENTCYFEDIEEEIFFLLNTDRSLTLDADQLALRISENTEATRESQDIVSAFTEAESDRSTLPIHFDINTAELTWSSKLVQPS